MKKQKIIAAGLALGLIASTIIPSIAETAGGTNEAKNEPAAQVVPFDMEKYKDINNDLGNLVINAGQEEVSALKSGKLAECTNEDYEEMYSSGMTHDEITEILRIAGEQGDKIKDVISEVKESEAGGKINKESLKKELEKRRGNAKNSLSSANSTGRSTGEILIAHVLEKQKELEREGKPKNDKIIIIEGNGQETLKSGPVPPSLPGSIASPGR